MVDQAKLSEFLGVTGCDDPAKARFFLESANGDLGAAVSAFYEHGDAPTEAPDPSPPSATAPTPAAGSAGAGPASAPAARPAPARASTRAASNVRGFGDLGGRDDDDDDDEKPQEWFTGGAQSGSVVQDPKKPQSDAERLERVLDGARAAGAVQGNAEDLDPRGRARPGAFSGTGRTLGSTAGGPEDAAASAGASAGASAAALALGAHPRDAHHRLLDQRVHRQRRTPSRVRRPGEHPVHAVRGERDSALASFSPRIPTRPSTSTS